MTRKTIQRADPSIFSYQDWVDQLAQQPTALDRLLELVDFESFRKPLEKPFRKQYRGPGGRPAFDVVLMFKVLILQRLHNLSDDQAEFQIRDRFSFQRFLGLTVADRMPDAKTIWRYREIWTNAGTVERCFTLFQASLAEHGVVESPGKIVDATFVDVPKQRNSREENAHIKESGSAPDDWKDNAAKLRQKDVDARWAKKNDETHYGYKCHTLVSSITKMIEGYSVTAANVHDSQVFTELLSSGRDAIVYADSAYRSEAIEAELAAMDIISKVAKRGTNGHPLSEDDRAYNRFVSQTRCRVEHVFGHMTNSMKAMYIRSIGLVRASGIIGLNNLAYNMTRLGQILRARKACA
jgi:IS5 family transposase